MKKLLPVLLLGIAACTQTPVSVVFKGDQVFTRNPSQTASVANPYQSRFEIRSEGVAEPQRVGGVGVAELPPLKNQPEPQRFVDQTQPQGRIIAAAPAYQPQSYQIPASGEQTARFSNAAVRVESPAGSSEINNNWYQGKITLASAERVVGEETITPAVPHQSFIWPVRGRVISHFGPKANGLHNDGINIAANAGEPFYAAADGVVVYAANDLKGFGNMVILRHAEGWMTAYDHADRLLVKQNERVRQGQQIGVVGATGSVNQAQLHFGLRQGKQPVDPSKHLGSAYAAR